MLETIRTCRAMRHLAADPVPRHLLEGLVEAATCAPSPGNTQGWDFVVVDEAPVRGDLAAVLRNGVRPLLPAAPARRETETAAEAGRRRLLESANHLLDRATEVPAWILVCGRPVYPPAAPSVDWIGAAAYPAAQNLLLAARGLGLGATFTTWHMPSEKAVRALLAIPDEARIVVTVPVGWPTRPFGPVRRRPVGDVLHWQRWKDAPAGA